MPEVNPSAAAAEGLRELADFLEAHPEAKLPNLGTMVWHYVQTPDELQELVKALGGKWKKGGDESYFTLDRAFGPFAYHIYAPRKSVCTAVTVGTREVTKREAVDKDAAWKLEAELRTLPTHEVTVTEPVVEWKCPTLLEGS